jgi:T-complex protein 1 subunit beta
MNQQAQVSKGENARLSSFMGAIAIADLVKSTLGPKGMDKILQSVSDPGGELTITNDGATILKSVAIDNAAARVLVDIAKTQDSEVGDGTTSVTVLTGELLREAEGLISQRLHPMTVIRGWRMATDVARAALEASAVDHSADPELFRADLMKIASTTLSSKLLSWEKEHFATLAVDAVLRLGGSGNIDHIKIVKKAGGSLRDSYLEEGYIMEKSIGVGCPKRLSAKELGGRIKILVADTSMDTDKIKIYGARVRVTDLEQVALIEAAEKAKMKAKVQKIVDHGIHCFVNRQLVYNWPEQLFAEAGVMCIEHADFDGIERLGKVTGGEICSTFDHPELVTLGECDMIEEIMIGEDKVIRFSGCNSGEACTIVLRGASQHVLDEAERSLHDALCVLTQTVKHSQVTLGGGCAEMLMAKVVDELAPTVPGKAALAIEAFGRALRKLPAIIADNGGFDSAELVANLRAAHYEGRSESGLDMVNGTVGNVRELGVFEPLKLKLQVLLSAAEAAEMILRVDEIVKCAPRPRQQQ